MTDFQSFPSIARYSRDVVITEKIDGTNAQIEISDDGITMRMGSRRRWITPEADNHGFAKWACRHRRELFTLGPGRHYGEWWGSGIQRRYGLVNSDRRFSLFNTGRWTKDPDKITETRLLAPECCSVVPVLYWGDNEPQVVDVVMEQLARDGSKAAPGFMKPEGLVWYHTRGGFYLKKTFGKEDFSGKDHEPTPKAP